MIRSKWELKEKKKAKPLTWIPVHLHMLLLTEITVADLISFI